MYSYRPTYSAPAPEHLKRARDIFLVNHSSDHHYITSFIDPLFTSGKYHLVIAFWIFYLESQEVTSETSRETKDTPREEIAKYALKITPANACDAGTRLVYLVKFADFIKQFPAHKLQHELTLYYITRLLFKMNLIDKPTLAIQRFGEIPEIYAAEKKKAETSGLMSYLKETCRKALFNRDADRARQLNFIKIVHQLVATLDRAKAPFHLEDHIKGIATWLIIEMELETNTQTSDSQLSKILFRMLGYIDRADIPAHSSLISPDIKKLRLMQLNSFLAEITHRQWEAARSAAGCSAEELAVCLAHYFYNFKETLDSLSKTTIVPKSTKEAAVIVAKRTAWNIGRAVVVQSIPNAVNGVYYGIGCDKATAKIAELIARKAGEFTGSTLRWIVETPVRHASEAAAGAGIKTGMALTFSHGVKHYLGEDSTESKDEAKPPLIPSSILFVDFLKLCLETASKGHNIKRCEEIEAILQIFPQLPDPIQHEFNRNVPSWYYVPGSEKGKCPFLIEMPTPRVGYTGIPVEVPPPSPSVTSPPPSPPPHSATPSAPPPEVPAVVIAVPFPKAPPLSPLRAAGMTSALSTPAIPPPPAYEEQWDLCGDDTPSIKKIVITT